MKTKFILLSLLLITSVFVKTQNGKIISRQIFELSNYDILMNRIAVNENGKRVYKKEYEYLNTVTLEGIFYESDGLKVKAYLVTPKGSVKGGYPSIIYNRGGNRDFG